MTQVRDESRPVTLHEVDPVRDRRWADFLKRHPAASAFHTVAWTTALQKTYGYEPVVYTTSSPDEHLTNAVLLCAVRSSLTGRRMVSVPFADHCDPLVASLDSASALLDTVRRAIANAWNYVEFRPKSAELREKFSPVKATTVTYRFHELDLAPTIENIFKNFHKSTIQRSIRRAEREGLVYTEGRSETMLRESYRLTLLTRRRHGVPPQPIKWFRNLINSFGDDLKIRVVYAGAVAVGSILTLRHNQTLVYKYGCSDAAAHRLGVMPFLFWKTILDAKSEGLSLFDLGRTDSENHGLSAFKNRLGAAESALTYIRYSASDPRPFRQPNRPVSQLLARLPDALFSAAGRLLYRHLG